jgi:hypothetical protein
VRRVSFRTKFFGGQCKVSISRCCSREYGGDGG